VKQFVTKFIILFLIVTAPIAAIAGEREDLERDLRDVQRELDVERYRYDRAKAEMERADLVARFVFPRLQQREAEIKRKIEEIDKKKN